MVYVTQVCWHLASRIRTGICHTGLLTACEQDQDAVLILLASCQQTCMTYTIAVCTVKTPDDGQRNCLKHVEFYSKNKFVFFLGRNCSQRVSSTKVMHIFLLYLSDSDYILCLFDFQVTVLRDKFL